MRRKCLLEQKPLLRRQGCPSTVLHQTPPTVLSHFTVSPSSHLIASSLLCEQRAGRTKVFHIPRSPQHLTQRRDARRK